MKNIATLADASDVADTIAKHVRLLGKEGISWEDYIRPMNDRTARKNLAAFIKARYPKLPTTKNEAAIETVSGYELARLILGTDFITPEEVVATARLGIVYSEDQLDEFAQTLPSVETLAWCRANDFMVVPTSPTPLSLLQIRDLKPEYFYAKTGGWYANEKERFSRDMKTGSGWLMLRKGALPNSFNARFDNQMKLLSTVEYVPSDAEVEWGVTTYKAVRGVFLLPNFYVKTSSIDSDGARVDVGVSEDGGLHVNDWYDMPGSDIGLASARKS
jgi:hypothetical protein